MKKLLLRMDAYARKNAAWLNRLCHVTMLVCLAAGGLSKAAAPPLDTPRGYAVFVLTLLLLVFGAGGAFLLRYCLYFEGASTREQLKFPMAGTARLGRGTVAALSALLIGMALLTLWSH